MSSTTLTEVCAYYVEQDEIYRVRKYFRYLVFIIMSVFSSLIRTIRRLPHGVKIVPHQFEKKIPVTFCGRGELYRELFLMRTAHYNLFTFNE